MARPKKSDAEPQNGGEVKKIDVDNAFRIVRNDIKPNISKVGEHNQEVSTAYKAIKKDCGIPSWIIKLGLKLESMEDFKRDHEMRALNLWLAKLGFDMIPADLVDQAEGKGDTNVIPLKAGDGGGLATLADDDDEWENADPAKAAAE
jgi:hypothetical protein